jgi:hypothetical protein
MRFVIVSHSVISFRNHGDAHRLRGAATEPIHAGHGLKIVEPDEGGSEGLRICAHRVRELLTFVSREVSLAGAA